MGKKNRLKGKVSFGTRGCDMGPAARGSARWGARTLALVTCWAFLSSQMIGCAAGNFGLVRTVGNWNLRMSLIPRVLVYVLLVIVPVYEFTIFFDLVINNTIEFWTGSPIIHAQNETFHSEGRRVEVAHAMTPLRKSVFRVYDKAGKLQSVTEIRETEHKTVELYVNGQKIAEADSIGDLVKLSYFGSKGSSPDRVMTFSRESMENLVASVSSGKTSGQPDINQLRLRLANPSRETNMGLITAVTTAANYQSVPESSGI